jgi:hypothetical protein
LKLPHKLNDEKVFPYIPTLNQSPAKKKYLLVQQHKKGNHTYFCFIVYKNLKRSKNFR